MNSSSSILPAEFWGKIIIIVGPWTTALLLHYSFLYTGIPLKKYLVYIIYTICGIFTIIAPANLIITGMKQVELGYIPQYGYFVIPYLITMYVFILWSLSNLIRFRRSTGSREIKFGISLVIAGIVIAIAGNITDFLHSLELPVIPMGIAGNIILSLLASFSFLRYHAIDKKALLRKSIAYLFFTSIVVAIFLILTYLIRNIFQGEDISLAINFLLFLAIALGLSPAFRSIQELVDRWFYYETYDKLKALENFSLQTYRIDDLDQLSFSLVNLISQALRTPDVHLMLMSASGDLITVASTRGEDFQYSIKRNGSLYRWLKSNKKILRKKDIDTIPQLRSIGAIDLQHLDRTRAELLIPLITRQSQLAGLIILGEKNTKTPYSEEDKQLAALVAGNTATELENARLIQQQSVQKTEFLHAIAHELKTPLTAILSSSELLTEEASIPDKIKQKMLINIKQSAELMDKRVTELLDLARVQIGVLNIQTEPIVINDIINNSCSQLLQLFKSKQQQLTVKMKDTPIIVNADGQRINQVMHNLLSNSHKFSPAEGEITVRTTTSGNRVIVEVEDPADLIPANERKRIFEPYYRGDNLVKKQQFQGMGLGLAISKRIIELHHGEIWYKAENNLKRNIFGFALPLVKDKQMQFNNSNEVKGVDKIESTNYRR